MLARVVICSPILLGFEYIKPLESSRLCEMIHSLCGSMPSSGRSAGQLQHTQSQHHSTIQPHKPITTQYRRHFITCQSVLVPGEHVRCCHPHGKRSWLVSYRQGLGVELLFLGLLSHPSTCGLHLDQVSSWLDQQSDLATPSCCCLWWPAACKHADR